ncbi:MAG: FkbM family methyltransferase [Lachnospiraceae bacterium]|nr:FkbM family methyltransferase [Lachnospiraceae bacterium]
MLEELKKLNIKENLADELKRQNLPLVMWGAGEIAEEVNFYLKKNDIKLDDVFVDNEYYSENVLFDGKMVLSASMLREKYKVVNVILGCSNYERIKSIEKLAFVNKVFYLFSYTYGLYEKTPLDEIKENIDEFEKINGIFADDLSSQNYLAFLKTRVSGNNSYVFDLFKRESNYFNNDIFKADAKEVLMDIGAFDGDTIRLFLKESGGHYKHVYALEPDKVNREMLEKYVHKNALQNVTIAGEIPWKEEGELHFVTNENGQLSSLVFNENGRAEGVGKGIRAKQLDEMFQYTENITLIKINYLEGVKEALQGAENILKIHKPKLAISVGFDCNNIRSVPMIIKEINPDYKLYLRYNRATVSALTCYGII